MQHPPSLASPRVFPARCMLFSPPNLSPFSRTLFEQLPRVHRLGLPG